jgi:hypothetical protein
MEETDVILNCENISKRFKGYFVYCNKALLMSSLQNSENADDNRGIMISSYQSLTKYSKSELCDLFDNKRDTKEFRNWCDNVPIFFASRFHLSNGSIPIAIVSNRKNRRLC